MNDSRRPPTWVIFLMYHLPFLLQVSLLHQKFHSKPYERYQRQVRILRLLLIPVNLWITRQMKRKFCFSPPSQRGPFNLQFACWVIHLAMKAIEWGLVSHPNDTYQLRIPFRHSLPPPKKHHPSQLQLHHQSEIKPETVGYSFKQVFIWAFHQLTSLRGINYNWGWKGREQPIPSIKQTLRLMLEMHVLQTIGLIGCVLSRDYGTAKGALLAMGVPNMVGLWTIGEILSTLSWGLVCSNGLEFSFCFLTLTSHFINWIHHHIVQLPTDFLQWWDLRLFVPLFNNPLKARSISDLWGNRWHQVYRRSFTFLGLLPASQFAHKLHLSQNSKRIFALFGGFFVSAILHETVITFVAPSPHRDSSYEKTANFRGSLFYFMMQPIGIMIESYIIGWIPGRMWVLIFTLGTAWPFKNQYTVHHRVIDDLYPPILNWTLKAFLWPPSIMQF